MNRIMTREEFDKLYLDKVVHCDTEEKANKFLALADSVGYKWAHGFSLVRDNRWKLYNKETCYRVQKQGLLYATIRHYISHGGYRIIKYEPQPKFKVGDKVRVNNTLYTTINGKVGVITKKRSSLITSLLLYIVEINNNGSIGNWCVFEDNLEKVEETIEDIIE